MRLGRLSVALALSLGLAAQANAGTAFYNGALTTASTTYDNPGGSAAGSGIHYYDVVQFTVDAPGTCVIESASVNTAIAGAASNALDTFLALYAVAFNPATPTIPPNIGFNDDFTGNRTVLPGPYVGTVPVASTGFTGASPGSRMTSPALLVATNYFLVTTSFRETNFVNTGTTAASTGPYWNGLNCAGNITIVPEPASLGLLGLGALALTRRRRA